MTSVGDLRELLVGSSILTVTISDWWTLGLSNGLWLVAQRVRSPEVAAIDAALETMSPGFLAGTIDADEVSPAVSVLRARRWAISDATTREDGELRIRCGDGAELWFATDADIVDWHWGLCESPGDPYVSFLAACVERGRIEVADRVAARGDGQAP